jgi:hypothetical protein
MAFLIATGVKDESGAYVKNSAVSFLLFKNFDEMI